MRQKSDASHNPHLAWTDNRQPTDIAGAVGMMTYPLTREVTLALANRLEEQKCAPRMLQLCCARIAYVVALLRPPALALKK